eukprot:scaffold8123_cov66-Phaeocystis_antarctica.AAC.5
MPSTWAALAAAPSVSTLVKRALRASSSLLMCAIFSGGSAKAALGPFPAANTSTSSKSLKRRAAPQEERSWATGRLPWRHATAMGVYPSPLVTLHDAPASSRTRTASTLSLKQATRRGQISLLPSMLSTAAPASRRTCMLCGLPSWAAMLRGVWPCAVTQSQLAPALSRRRTPSTELEPAAQ